MQKKSVRFIIVSIIPLSLLLIWFVYDRAEQKRNLIASIEQAVEQRAAYEQLPATIKKLKSTTLLVYQAYERGEDYAHYGGFVSLENDLPCVIIITDGDKEEYKRRLKEDFGIDGRMYEQNSTLSANIPVSLLDEVAAYEWVKAIYPQNEGLLSNF